MTPLQNSLGNRFANNEIFLLDGITVGRLRDRAKLYDEQEQLYKDRLATEQNIGEVAMCERGIAYSRTKASIWRDKAYALERMQFEVQNMLTKR